MANDIGSDPFRRTVVSVKGTETRIYRKNRMLWVGSCFVESIAPFLLRYKYNALINPLGVVFHPLVLLKLLKPESSDFDTYTFEKGGVWLNYLLGHPFHGKTREELNEVIGKVLSDTLVELRRSSWLVMTWGTAYVYDHKEFGLVGKCHKQPPSDFEKRISEPDEISHAWISGIMKLRESNPDLRILLTLSPVRHTRDGLAGNALSKAILRLAIQKVVDSLPGVYYFPSYEIMVDELREYRFFEADLIHPNREAIGYIWERFSSMFFPQSEINTNHKMQALWQLETHNPIVDYGSEYQSWMAEKEKRRSELDALIMSESSGV